MLMQDTKIASRPLAQLIFDKAMGCAIRFQVSDCSVRFPAASGQATIDKQRQGLLLKTHKLEADTAVKLPGS